MSRNVRVGIVAVGIVALGPAGCGGSDIRVANDSEYTVEQLQITTPSNSEAYGTLGPGQLSDYRTFDEAYDYAQASFVSNGYLFEITPIDYVGEEELGSGEFTYHLVIDDFGQGLAHIYTTED